MRYGRDGERLLVPRRPSSDLKREPGQGAFADQLPLELGQRREDAEHEPPGGGGGVDLRALAPRNVRAIPHARPRGPAP